jgi:hypothetical protein
MADVERTNTFSHAEHIYREIVNTWDLRNLIVAFYIHYASTINQAETTLSYLPMRRIT